MQAVSIAGAELSDFRFDHDDDLSDLGGAASRFKFNVAAISLLKRLEAESRAQGELTQEERRTLARYTGWGDSDVLGRAFPNGTYSWSHPCTELQELLTQDEIKSLLATRSTPISQACRSFARPTSRSIILASLRTARREFSNWIPAIRSHSEALAELGDLVYETPSGE